MNQNKGKVLGLWSCCCFFPEFQMFVGVLTYDHNHEDLEVLRSGYLIKYL